MAKDKDIITQAARKYGVDPKILWGLYGTETSFGKNVSRSSAGAVGPFQFLPSTAKGMGVNPYDFRSAAYGAAKYLSQYKNRGVGGMLSAYNAGPAGGFQKGYVDTTLKNAQSYGGGGGSPIPQVPQARAPRLPGLSKETGQTFDQAGFQKAQKSAVLGKLLSASGERKDNPLFAAGLVGGRPPVRSEYESQGAPEGPHILKVPGASVYVPPKQAQEEHARESSGAPATGGYPLGRVGKMIGTPYSGTHTLGNWESDNAIDLAVPKGTPVYAVEDGTIGSQIGSLSASSSRFAGLRLHLASGRNEWYYAHLSKLAVHAGEHVRVGQLLGYSGEANGVQHLHIASKHGSPVGLTKKGR